MKLSLKSEPEAKLLTIKLYRYYHRSEIGNAFLNHIINFRSEYGRYARASWKLVSRVIGKDAYLYKLDGRSVRYMKRVEIIENEKPSNKPYKTVKTPAAE